MSDKKVKKKITLAVDEDMHRNLKEMVKYKNKQAGANLYSNRTLLDVLIFDAWKSIFGSSKKDQ